MFVAEIFYKCSQYDTHIYFRSHQDCYDLIISGWIPEHSYIWHCVTSLQPNVNFVSLSLSLNKYIHTIFMCARIHTHTHNVQVFAHGWTVSKNHWKMENQFPYTDTPTRTHTHSNTSTDYNSHKNLRKSEQTVKLIEWIPIKSTTKKWQ